MRPTLHGYFRSTASWRVRIALNLKRIGYADRFHHLRKGEHLQAAYLDLNPQGLLPTLELEDGRTLTQSLAICEYLDEVAPEPPLLPGDAWERAHVRAFAQVIACDIHPVQNLKVLSRLRDLGLGEEAVTAWAREVIETGLNACSALLPAEGGDFAFGPQPSLADLCLVPQLGNARRFGVELRWPRLLEIEAACRKVSAFQSAEPQNQADAE